MNPTINVYTCKHKHQTVTIDTVEGVTPMLIPCPQCRSEATSAWYKCDQSLTPTHEWYKPSSDEELKLTPAAYDHVRRGGLLLRKIKK